MRLKSVVACLNLALLASLVGPSAASGTPAQPTRYAFASEDEEFAFSRGRDSVSTQFNARAGAGGGARKFTDCPSGSLGLGITDGAPVHVKLRKEGPEFELGAIPASWWTNPPNDDPSWQLEFRALMWLTGIATDAAANGATATVAATMQQALDFHTQNPDPGTSALGWDEGAATRRLQVLNCLYGLTGDVRLLSHMEPNAEVLFSYRYYGPPRHKVHNHGLMANLVLIKSAGIIDRPQWRAAAVQRIVDEYPGAFSRAGTSLEQSSVYHGVNLNLWTQAAEVLQASPVESERAQGKTLMAGLTKAHGIISHLTDPDGTMVQFGDSTLSTGALEPQPRLTFTDKEAGVTAGRWSWTNNWTTYYTLRYGVMRRAHGHEDRSGVTWSTRGMRILTNPGRYNYNTLQPWFAWSRSPVSHNVSIPRTGEFRPKAPVFLSAQKESGQVRSYSMTDRQYAMDHKRVVVIDQANASLRVTDTWPVASRQYFHLDPAWKLVKAAKDSRTAVFRHASGRTLTVRTTGRISGVARGKLSPLAGWYFPDASVRVSAEQLAVRSVGKTLATTLSVG